jgi:hypothetical protein
MAFGEISSNVLRTWWPPGSIISNYLSNLDYPLRFLEKYFL